MPRFSPPTARRLERPSGRSPRSVLGSDGSRFTVLLVCAALLALLCVPALVGFAAADADADVAGPSAASDGTSAEAPTISVDPERPMAGTHVDMRLTSDGNSIDRVQWEVVAPNGTVMERTTYARRSADADVNWTDDIVWTTEDPTEFRHEFASKGNFTVRTTFGEDADTVERTVSVRPERLTAQLVVSDTEPVVGEPIITAADATGNVSSFSLESEDGQTLLARSWGLQLGSLFPETFRYQLLTYHEPGEREIAYTVRNATGGRAVNRTTVDVRSEDPDADLAARLESTYEGPGTGYPLNRTVEFDASGTSGNVSTYWWLFGDGAFDRTTLPTTTYSYDTNGTYETAVIAVGPNATDRTSVRTTVGGNTSEPRISVSLEDSLVDDHVQFRVQPKLDSIREYRWEFPDGNRTDKPVAFAWRSWSESGTYTINVTLVPWVGESLTLARTVRIDVDDSGTNLSVPNETVVVDPADWVDDRIDGGTADEGSGQDDAEDSDTAGSGLSLPTGGSTSGPDSSPPEPAFEIQSIDVPEDVEPGSDVRVTVEVRNDGGTGDGEVAVSLPDGVQQHVYVTADGDATEAVTTSIEVPADEGEYDLQVQTASDEQTATLSVADSAGEDAAGNETESAASSGDDAGADSDDATPAFGVLGSIIAIAASVLAVRRRS